MNADRRKRLSAASVKVNDARSALEDILNEEQEAYDNMPENMQGGEKGDKAQDIVNSLEEIIQNLENAETELGNIADQE